MRRPCASLLLALSLPLASLAAAQSPVPIRPIGSIEARSTIAMGNIYQIHARSDGRVLVNDAIKQRLILFDSTLATYRILADNSGNAPSGYGNNPLELVAFEGDSTLVLDGRSFSFSLYDVDGRVTRIIAAPKPADVMTIIGYGTARLDGKGRLVYRGVLRTPPAPPLPAGAQPDPTAVVVTADSVPLVRADFETRVVDTIAMLRVVPSRFRMQPTPTGGFTRISIINPINVYDVWTVNSLGDVAVVRAHDYHVDWIRTDNTRTSSPKMQFDWRPLSDADKAGILDSARTAMEKAMRARAAAMPAGAVMPQFEFVEPRALPDYMPPFRAGSVRPDRDGNIWLPPTTSFDAQAGQVLYNVVNTKGEIAQRVRVPFEKVLVGFGGGGAMFLTVTDSTGVYLERTRVK